MTDLQEIFDKGFSGKNDWYYLQLHLYVKTHFKMSCMINRSTDFSLCLSEAAMMPGQIPDLLMTAGSLPSVGPLAGIPSTTLTDQLKLAELYSLGTVLSPLILNRHAKRPFDVIKDEVRTKHDI